MEKTFGITLLILSAITSSAVEESCSKAYGCLNARSNEKYPRYILYDVNVGEGFNLKRDVYMRMAMFARTLAKKTKEDWHLVLPPWTRQWHWKKEDREISLKWLHFFDVFSLQLYSPVMEIDQFHAENGNSVDEVYILQHFPEFYDWKGDSSTIDWSERWSFAECRESPHWRKDNGSFIFFSSKYFVKAKRVECVSFQGTSAYLESMIPSDVKSIMFDRAEIATHMTYGDSEYWSCRRSMRFAKHLEEAAVKFRTTFLISCDDQDKTVRPQDWREERPHRSALGGPYLGVHLRRQDFILGRTKEVPSLDQTIRQIKNSLIQINLTTVFIATDMDSDEYEYIKIALTTSKINVVRYIDDNTELKDGELAIIDQIIASHARHFVGTHESTFSYRIQEEREIMGFPPDSTFNRFCPNFKISDCSQPTRWLIKFPDDSFHEQNFRYNRKDDEL